MRKLELAAPRRERELNGGEVVFGVRVGEREGGVGVALAEDVRHAVAVAHDAALRHVLERGGVGRARATGAAGGGERGPRRCEHETPTAATFTARTRSLRRAIDWRLASTNLAC